VATALGGVCRARLLSPTSLGDRQFGVRVALPAKGDMRKSTCLALASGSARVAALAWIASKEP
jgi:hypothetical protein